VLNDAAFGYVRKHSLCAPLIARLMAQAQTRFADQAAWMAHLERLSFTTPDVMPATKAGQSSYLFLRLSHSASFRSASAARHSSRARFQ
jgi:hypothetical protein